MSSTEAELSCTCREARPHRVLLCPARTRIGRSLAADQRDRLEQPEKVLVRALQRNGESKRARAQVVPAPKLLLGIPTSRRWSAEPVGNQVDLLFRDLEETDEVVAGRSGRDDDAIRAARGERDQRAQRERTPPVRLGVDAVDDVVNRGDAPEGAPHRRGARKAVDDVYARALCEPRQKQLLAANPCRASSSVDRHGYRRDELAPCRVCRCFAIDEGRQAKVGLLTQQRSRQLARIGLQARSSRAARER